MNNKTIHKFTIKLRGDNVYDLYLDDTWVGSRGSAETVLSDLKDVMISTLNK